MLENTQLAENAFLLWMAVIKINDWSTPEDIQFTFNSADLLGNGTNRVVFNLAGNNYRMICKYSFAKTRVHLAIRWIGTHAGYTKVCKSNQQYQIRLY